MPLERSFPPQWRYRVLLISLHRRKVCRERAWRRRRGKRWRPISRWPWTTSRFRWSSTMRGMPVFDKRTQSWPRNWRSSTNSTNYERRYKGSLVPRTYFICHNNVSSLHFYKTANRHFYFSGLVKTPTAHRQSSKAQRPAATAGGRQAAPGSGTSEGVGGTPWQRERICNQTPTDRASSKYKHHAWSCGSTYFWVLFVLVHLLLSCWKKQWSLRGCVSWWSSRKFTSNSRFPSSLCSFRARFGLTVLWLCCCNKHLGTIKPSCFVAITVHREVWRVSDDSIQEQWGLHHIQTGDGEGGASVRAYDAGREGEREGVPTYARCDDFHFFLFQMTKKIKKLEKETAMYRSRWESSNKALLEMAEEVIFHLWLFAKVLVSHGLSQTTSDDTRTDTRVSRCHKSLTLNLLYLLKATVNRKFWRFCS